MAGERDYGLGEEIMITDDIFDHIEALKEKRKPGLSSFDCHMRPTGVGRKKKTSRYRGVHSASKGTWSAWCAKIKEPEKENQTFLGYFHDEDKAAEAYNIAAKAIYGENDYQNVINNDPHASGPSKEESSSEVGASLRKWIGEADYVDAHKLLVEMDRLGL